MVNSQDMQVYVESFTVKVDAVSSKPITPDQMADFMLGLGEVAEKLGWRVIQLATSDVFEDEIPEDG